MELEYNISQLGRLNAYILNPYAINCYEFLNKNGYIDKLGKMDQLGVIRNTTLGTKHSRYEYVFLQLFLINQLLGKKHPLSNKLENDSFRLGLSRKFKITVQEDEEQPSGAEIIQIWILLFNSGHLLGTFASERGLLKAFKNNENLFKVFKEGLPKKFQDLFKKTVKNNRLHEIHKFLIIFMLERHKRGKHPKLTTGTDLIYFLEEIIYGYLKDKNKKLKKIYNKIRKLSYLFLDSQYSTFPITFNLNPLLINLNNYLNDLFDDSSYFNESLTSLDNLLNHDIYYSQESIMQFGLHSTNIYKKIMEKQNINLTLLKKIFISHPQFFDYSSENTVNYNMLHLFFNIPFKPMFENFTKKINLDLEDKWNKYVGKNSLLIIENNFEFSFVTFSLIFIKGTKYNYLLSINRLMLKIIGLKNSFYLDFKENILNNSESNLIPFEFYDILIDDIFKNPLEHIFLTILNTLFEDISIELEEYSFNPRILSIYGKSNIEREFNKLRNNHLKKSVKYEVLVTKEFAKKYISHQSKALISVASLKFIDKQEICEFDGCILMFKDNKINLYFIEAKDYVSGGINASKKELNEKLKKINIKPEYIDCTNELKGTCAYCKFSNSNLTY